MVLFSFVNLASKNTMKKNLYLPVLMAMVSLYSFNCDELKTGWILESSSGRSSRYVFVVGCSMILCGPAYFATNFRARSPTFRFSVDNITCSPTLNLLKLLLMYIHRQQKRVFDLCVITLLLQPVIGCAHGTHRLRL